MTDPEAYEEWEYDAEEVDGQILLRVRKVPGFERPPTVIETAMLRRFAFTGEELDSVIIHYEKPGCGKDSALAKLPLKQMPRCARH